MHKVEAFLPKSETSSTKKEQLFRFKNKGVQSWQIVR